MEVAGHEWTCRAGKSQEIPPANRSMGKLWRHQSTRTESCGQVIQSIVLSEQHANIFFRQQSRLELALLALSRSNHTSFVLHFRRSPSDRRQLCLDIFSEQKARSDLLQALWCTTTTSVQTKVLLRASRPPASSRRRPSTTWQIMDYGTDCAVLP